MDYFSITSSEVRCWLEGLLDVFIDSLCWLGGVES